jgi:hypothetical protein
MLLARQAGVGQLGPCDIVVRTVLPDRRGRHDTAACYPSYKAAQDGLVDAGVWPDDNPKWVRTVVFEAPVIRKGQTGLELELRPVADPPAA